MAEAEEEMAFETAAFGLAEDVSGEIMRADPLMADKELANGEQVKGKVVVVGRGVVPFVDKARRVEAAGAVCMVVVNNAEELYRCTGQGDDIKIPVVCVSKGDGELLVDGSMARLKGVQYGAGTLCYVRKVAPNAGGGGAGKTAGGGVAGMGLSLGGAAKVGVPVAAASGGYADGGDSDADSEDSDDWMGEVDVEEYKRLRNTVKLRLDDCDHEMAGQLEVHIDGFFGAVLPASMVTPCVRSPVSLLDDRGPLSVPVAREKSALLSTLTPLPPVRAVASHVQDAVIGEGDIIRKLDFVEESKDGDEPLGACSDPVGAAGIKVKAHHLRALPSLAVHRVAPRSPDNDKAVHSFREEWSGHQGGLSKLTSGVDAKNPKFQVAMNAHRSSASMHSPSASVAPRDMLKSKMLTRTAAAGKSRDGGGGSVDGDWCGEKQVADNNYYFEQRQTRPLYRNKDVHCMVLELALQLIIDADGPLLDPQHTHQFPLEKHRPNIPFLLRAHMNHPANENVLPQLLARVSARGDQSHRLLKLLVDKLFQPLRYSNRDPAVRFRGAFGTVYRVVLPWEPFELALKVIELPKDIHAPCTLQDLFTEVSIMEHLKSEPRMCHIYDFGVDKEHCYIVTAWYRMSLKHWRTHQREGLLDEPTGLRLLVAVGARVLAAMCRLADARVVHYDIKCDNLLLVADGSVSDAELLDHYGRDVPSFDVVVTDFGESKIYSPWQDGYTTRNRGTEYIKSPEMLTVANASSKERANFDRRKKNGANKASDVWGAACVLYELLTGEYLFYDEDWIRFFIRVTGASPEDLIPPERLAPLRKLEGGKHLIDFFKYALVRDALRRPSLHDLATRWDAMAASLAQGTSNLASGGEASHASASEQGAAAGACASRSVQSLHATNLAAKRLQRDANRACAALLHEPVTATEVDRELQGKSAVSLQLEGGVRILCGANPVDLEWVDGQRLEGWGALGVGYILDCSSSVCATSSSLVNTPGTIYSQSPLPSLLLGSANASASSLLPRANPSGLAISGRGSGTEVRPGAKNDPLTLQLKQLVKDVSLIEAAGRQGSSVLVFDDAGGASWAAGIVMAYLMQVLCLPIRKPRVPAFSLLRVMCDAHCMLAPARLL